MAKALIVDDNAQNLYLLETLLKSAGHTVRSALNGRIALEYAMENIPDIIISDILMPEMDGYELCRRWKKDEVLKQIPFIFYTATYTESKDEKLALSLGADHFLVKPQKPEILQQVIDRTLEEHRAKGGLSAGKPLVDEAEVLRQYNEVLFAKLERKVQQLESEIIVRKKAEEDLKKTLREKEILLNEVHHRVRNNLQMILSIIGMQTRMDKNRTAEEALTAAGNRIRSISLIHELLYTSNSFSEMNTEYYITSIIEKLITVYGTKAKVSFTVDTAGIILNVNTMIPLGIIVNECASNALEHAFAGRDAGAITVHLKKEADRYQLLFSDDGSGLPRDFKLDNVHTLGFCLITNLAKQISGEVDILPGEGTIISINFTDAHMTHHHDINLLLAEASFVL